LDFFKQPANTEYCSELRVDIDKQNIILPINACLYPISDLNLNNTGFQINNEKLDFSGFEIKLNLMAYQRENMSTPKLTPLFRAIP
jgi:hypothetical protein